MFKLEPTIGTLDRALNRSLVVAQNSPRELFIFVFNDVYIYLDPNADFESHLKEYQKAEGLNT